MLKNLSVLEHKVGDKIFQFLCDPSSEINHAKEALYKFLGYVDSVEQAMKTQQAAQAAAPAAEAPPAPVEPPKE